MTKYIRHSDFTCAVFLGCSIESIWTFKNQIKYIDTKPVRRHTDQWNFHTWRMESFGKFVQYEPIHVNSLFWSDCIHITTRVRRRTSHSEIATKVEPYRKGAFERNVLDLVSLEKTRYGNQNPWSASAEREERTGQFVVGTDQKTVSGSYHEQSVESSFCARYSKWDDYQAWSSQVENWHFDVWAIGATRFHHLERDTWVSIEFLSPGDPARWNSAIQCERGHTLWLTGVTRCHPCGQDKTIVNECYRIWRKHSLIWWMFMSVTMQSAVFLGKIFQSEFHCEHCRSHTETNVRHIYDISDRTRWDLRFGNDWLGNTSTMDWYLQARFQARDKQYFSSFWPQGPRAQRSWKDWLECTTSCTIFA